MYDKGPKLGVRRKRKARETMLKLEKALEELSTKLKVWGAAVHGKVRQLVPPYNCQATRHAKCYVNSLCKDVVHAKYYGSIAIWFCMLYAACVSRALMFLFSLPL